MLQILLRLYQNTEADATRWYMISNANPWDNLKFDSEGIAEVSRKFFGTLYNTYSFFTLYTNLDGFNYSEADIPLNERPEIDRWILSELNTLIQKNRCILCRIRANKSSTSDFKLYTRVFK